MINQDKKNGRIKTTSYFINSFDKTDKEKTHLSLVILLWFFTPISFYLLILIQLEIFKLVISWNIYLNTPTIATFCRCSWVCYFQFFRQVWCCCLWIILYKNRKILLSNKLLSQIILSLFKERTFAVTDTKSKKMFMDWWISIIYTFFSLM